MNEVVQFQAPRLPYHAVVEERFGIDKSGWKVLVEAVFPAAESPDSIVMALAYCRARNLDIFKKPVQIVPIWDKKRSRMVDTVWPGIAELRTTAMRTGSFAGFDETEFGPMIDAELSGVKVSYPEWAQCIVYRLVGGQRVAFIGPKVFWIETYATAKKDTKAPNNMWAKRPRGQLEKCAEAAALRRAFPEELGNDIAAEEIAPYGSVRDVTEREAPNLAARLAAPKEEGAPAEGFSTANASPLGDDDIPDFSQDPPKPSDDDFPGDQPNTGAGDEAGPAEANADEGTGPAADLLQWQRKLIEDMDGLSLEQLDHLTRNPSDIEMFEALEAEQPQLAMDLNKAITRRRKELA